MCGDEGVGGKEEEEEDEEIPPTPVPKEWDCLGSDLEIKEGIMEPGRPLVSGLCVTCLLVCVGFSYRHTCSNWVLNDIHDYLIKL